MAERKHTVVCIFEQNSPRISAFEIHEWIYEQLHISEESLNMIQIDGIRRHVYLKFVNELYVTELLRMSKGRMEYRHLTGEISAVRLEPAGMGTRRIRIANLPPETAEDTLRTALAPYGDIVSIQEEVWSRTYRYKVANGIKVVMMKVRKHLPSHMAIAGHRVLVSYEGQPSTCYACGDTGHIHQACPNRRRAENTTGEPNARTWANIVTNGPRNRGGREDGKTDTISPSTAGGGIQEHQEEELARMHPPEYVQNMRENEESNTRRREQTPTQHGKECTNDYGDTDTPQMETDSSERELPTGTSKQQTREKQGPPPQEDGQESRMDIEKEPEQQQKQSDPVSAREDSTNKTDRPKAETAGPNLNTSSRTKKIKLENGKAQQRERKRSRSRTTTQRQDKP